MGLRRWAVVAWIACLPAIASAQTVEIAPVGGYRFGGGFFERVTGQEVDLDGAPSVGGVVNVRLHDALFVEALVTHQEAGVTVPQSAFGPATHWRITVDHYQAGGLQEFFDRRRTRPFLTGLLGLTRYAAAGDNEIRFTVSARRRREADARAAVRDPARRPGVRDVCRGRRPRDRVFARDLSCRLQRRYHMADRIHGRRRRRVLSAI